MDKIRPYFSFQGRANRQQYWLTVLASWCALFAGATLAISIPIVGSILFLAVIVAMVWAGLSLAVRRLHDRNKSGWWMLAMYGPVTLLSALSQLFNAVSEGSGLLFALLALPFSIWIIVELGCLKGASGSNRFGEDPLQPLAAQVFG